MQAEEFTMRITEIEVYRLSGPPETRVHWVSHHMVRAANELLVLLRTDTGLSGFGLASGGDLDAAASLFAEGLDEMIRGGLRGAIG